jgi:hypothetical protein
VQHFPQNPRLDVELRLPDAIYGIGRKLITGQGSMVKPNLSRWIRLTLVTSPVEANAGRDRQATLPRVAVPEQHPLSLNFDSV